MNASCDYLRRLSLASLLLLCSSSPATATEVLGYVGPGAGLTMLGALFAVLCVLLLALLAPILYPIRLLLAWRRRRYSAQPVPASVGREVASPS